MFSFDHIMKFLSDTFNLCRICFLFDYIIEKNGPDNYTHIIGQYCGKANKVYKGLLYVAKNTMLNNYIYVHIITWANIRGVHFKQKKYFVDCTSY